MTFTDPRTGDPIATPCAGRLDDWFPERRDDELAPKLACHACPIEKACLEYAMAEERGKSTAMRFGIWGGTTPEERFKLEFGNRGGRKMVPADEARERIAELYAAGYTRAELMDAFGVGKSIISGINVGTVEHITIRTHRAILDADVPEKVAA